MEMNKSLFSNPFIAGLFVTECSHEEEQSLILDGAHLEASTISYLRLDYK